MNATHRLTPRSATGYSTWPAAFVLALLLGTSALLASDARAQSNACEMLKNTLTARIDPSIHGFSMEIVPASTPVPRGAKVIGNCEAGARKILFRRFGGGSSAAASATEPAPASAVAPQAAPKAAPPLAVAPKKVEPPKPSSPLVQSDRDLRSLPAPSVALVPPRVAEAGPAVAVPARETPKTPSPRVSEAEALRAAEPALARPEVTTTLAPPPQETESSDLMAGPWRWAWALLLLPFAAWGWAWLARRRAYDEAGLPRGPKLN